MFDNANEFHRLYPETVLHPVRFCAPRVEEGWELERVRRRLADRAEQLATGIGFDTVSFDQLLAHREFQRPDADFGPGIEYKKSNQFNILGA